MKKVKYLAKCKICKSPFRGEIEFLLKQGASKSDIAKKYHQAFGIKVNSMYNKVVKHAKGNHAPLINMEPVVEAPATSEPMDFQAYAKKLLNVGFSPDMLTSKKVSHQNIIAAQRTLIEEEKVKGELNNQRLLLMKFFRGKPAELEGAIDGQITDSTNNSD